MSLREKIQQKLKEALKEKKELELSVLRMLNNAILIKEKDKRYQKNKENPNLKEKELEKESFLNEEEIIEVISSEIKKRREAILLFEKGNRKDLLEKEKKELEILERYLPEQLSEEEIKKLTKEIIEKNKIREIKDMGKVMAELMPKVKGRADGSLVSKIVKDLLNKS